MIGAEAGSSADVWISRAFRSRAEGRLEDSIVELDRGLALDPEHFLALLAKGAVLGALRRERSAARIYADALKLAPPDSAMPAELAGAVARARSAVETDKAELRAALDASAAGLDGWGATRERFDEAVAVFAGQARPFAQQPLLLHYPRLPAIPFHDRAAFAWLAELEAASGLIADELAAALADGVEGFAPYIEFPPGAPLNQWGALNHSPDWSAFYLWRDGVRQGAACARCPGTAGLLERLPMLEQPGFGPTAMFSALAPRTRIPPHTGSSNTRLIVHLPLVLPGKARFRVGNVTREWRMGEAWVFDDTIEHEAWNDAGARRIILIFDIWNPALSAPERAGVTAMMRARADHYAER